MKIYIHTDIEGVAGYCFHEDRLTGERARLNHVYRMRKLLTAEVNAALEALIECGAQKVVINDSHGSCYNLFFEELNPVAEIIHGAGTRMPMWIPCLDNTFDAMICLGQHAMEGTKGVLPHSRTTIQCGNGKEIALNETGVAMALAGCFGVPSILATGDSTLCGQVKGYVADIETVAVKEALSPYSARSVVPRKAHQMIKEGVKRAMARMAEIKPYVIAPPPFRMTLIGSTPGFDKKSEVFEDNDFYNLIKKALSTVYDYELYDAKEWPLVPRGELILNKHERAYKARLEREGKVYQPYLA